MERWEIEEFERQYTQEFEDQYADDLEVLNELQDDRETNLSDSLKSSIDQYLDKLSQQPESLTESSLEKKEVCSLKRSLDSSTQGQSPVKEISKKPRIMSPVQDEFHTSVDDSVIPNLSEPMEISECRKDNFVSKNRLQPLCRRIIVDVISVTTSDGSRTHLPVIKETDLEVATKKTLKSYAGSLLSAPISEMKLKILNDISYNHEDKEDNVSSSEDHHVNEDNRTIPLDKENSLWVEKYKPQHYMELLSDEGVNRTLLQWLKLWDKIVFGREKRKKMKSKKENKPPQPSKFNNPLFGISEELDEQNRPNFKVALLTGYPGLGKTTLAHVIAHHAGYKVVEMNASDDRSPEIFRNQLEASTQMKAMLGEDPRPNCLVIDEIDGAPAPSINLLVSLVKSTGTKKGKKKKDEFPLLQRPIICICNDQYTPALKPLRQIALILNFPPTATARLVSRLTEVAHRQCLKTDMAALLALCEKAENDIRSCLSTLQFIFQQKKELRLKDVHSLTVGQKDTQKSLFVVWQKIFQLPPLKRKRNVIDNPSIPGRGDNNKLNDNTSTTARFYDILGLTQRCGEYEKLIQGLYENYPLINFKDPQLDSLQNGTSWLCFTDLLYKEIHSTQLYTLLPYISYAPVAFHLLFAVPSFPRISFPNAHFEFKTKQKKFLNILSSLYNDMSTRMKCFTKKETSVLDLLPSLIYIIQPNLRPVNTQLFTESERMELRRVIDILIDFNINFSQQRTIDGHYEYVLEPNIEEIVKFPEIKSGRSLTYAAKQLIAKEVELEKMRHSDNAIVTATESKTKATKDTPMQNLNFKPVKNKQTLDFFGRRVCVTAKKGNRCQDKKNIWFHFKEGYSNAVRKTIRISDLL